MVNDIEKIQEEMEFYLLRDSKAYSSWSSTWDGTAKPFVKWAGGKYKLAKQLIPFMPNKFDPLKNTYIEPMVGSGGFFFQYASSLMMSDSPLKNVYLSDINFALIAAYKSMGRCLDIDSIRSESEFLTPYEEHCHSMDLLSHLNRHKENYKDEEYYYEQRKIFNKKLLRDPEEMKMYIDDTNLGYNLEGYTEEIASLFIFLNKTCFNGLYRENSKGEFNVPVGKNSKGELYPFNYDKNNLFAVRKILRFPSDYHNPTVEIACHRYEDSIDKVKEGDFVYLDPPYIPLDHLSFTKYSKDDFGKKEHKQLSDFCDSINSSGAYFMLSNSDTKDTREIYLKEGRFSKEFNVNRSIASKGENRVKAKELIITNYEL